MAVDDGQDTVSWALEYLERGWQPVKFEAGTKGPREKNWPDKRYTAEQIPAAFDGQNVGLLLGPASGGLVDVDFDDPLALHCALSFLPPTACSFGRASKPRSHAFYICEDVPAAKGSLKLEDPEHGCLLELRAQPNHQTMCPPSMHPDGERLEWNRCEDPARVPYAELGKLVRKAGAAALIAHRLGTGNRHGAMLLVAGALLRVLPKDAALPILRAAYEASGGRDWPDALRAIDDTAERLERKEHVTGRPALAKEWGDKVCGQIFDWLGLGGSKAAAAAKPAGNLGGRTGMQGKLTRFRWLWPGYVLGRSLNELLGHAGLGKSSVLADLAARVTAGLPWPDGQPNTLGPRNVAILSSEDDFWGTILPRALAAGAERGRVVQCDDVVTFDDAPDEAFTIAMHASLDAFLERWQPALMILDPLNSFMGGDVDSGKATQVRPRLEGLRPLLLKHDMAFLWIRHERKGDEGKGPLVHKGSGIADITAVARVSLMAFMDPDDEDLRYVSPAKSNLSKRMPTLPYRLENVATLDGAVDGDEQVRDVARVVWEAADERSAGQILSAKKSTREGSECVVWLHEQLAKGERIRDEVIQAGRDLFPRALIERTAKAAGVVAAGRGAAATWRMPF